MSYKRYDRYSAMLAESGEMVTALVRRLPVSSVAGAGEGAALSSAWYGRAEGGRDRRLPGCSSEQPTPAPRPACRPPCGTSAPAAAPGTPVRPPAPLAAPAPRLPDHRTDGEPPEVSNSVYILPTGHNRPRPTAVHRAAWSILMNGVLRCSN